VTPAAVTLDDQLGDETLTAASVRPVRAGDLAVASARFTAFLRPARPAVRAGAVAGAVPFSILLFCN